MSCETAPLAGHKSFGMGILSSEDHSCYCHHMVGFLFSEITDGITYCVANWCRWCKAAVVTHTHTFTRGVVAHCQA